MSTIQHNTSRRKISICQGDHYSEAVDVNKADELLDYYLGEDKLSDVITQVEILYRTVLQLTTAKIK